VVSRGKQTTKIAKEDLVCNVVESWEEMMIGSHPLKKFSS
jgi:hypothetical protein